jgi:hypothetical protein
MGANVTIIFLQQLGSDAVENTERLMICLRELHNADLREEEILGGWIRSQNLDCTQDEQLVP